MVLIDFFMVPTVTMRALFVFIDMNALRRNDMAADIFSAKVRVRSCL